jgi:hypothetical protein
VGLVDLESALIQVITQVAQSSQTALSVLISQSAQPLPGVIMLLPVVSPGMDIDIPVRGIIPSPQCWESNGTAEDDTELEDLLELIKQGGLDALPCDVLQKLLKKAEEKRDKRQRALDSVRRELEEKVPPCPDLPPEEQDDEDCIRLLRTILWLEHSVGKWNYVVQRLQDALSKCQRRNIGGAVPDGQESEVLRYDQLLTHLSHMTTLQNDISQAEATLTGCALTSWDPNDKVGIAGQGEAKHIRPNITMPYTVFFENLAAATAAAEEVLITDQLDSNLDWSTFTLDSIRIGERTITAPPSTQNFTTTVDLRPAVPALVEINLRFNPSTGRVEWLFRGKDSATGELTGFLPPNTADVAPRGEGSVSYRVEPKENLPTGTVIRNKATIDFEIGIPPAPMDTPEVSNTIDTDAPTSQVLSMDATQGSAGFEVQWSGTDAGSGIGGYTIYVSDNDGPYLPWLTNIPSTSAIFTGVPGHTYRFFSRARDKVGNFEDLRVAPDTTTWIRHLVYLPTIRR